VVLVYYWCILSSLQLLTNNGMCFVEDMVFYDPPGYLGHVQVRNEIEKWVYSTAVTVKQSLSHMRKGRSM
jgi:hypothetical protein